MKWVNLEEILDVAWPTDRDLVRSFRATLKRGDPFVPIQLNRVWQDGTAHYEIIDGFHRFEAAKAEHLAALCCQVVEQTEREARFARIRACLGKPLPVTGQRALLELHQAFGADMQTLIGTPDVLYEPILGETGQIQARQRAVPLPDDPWQALEALTDHLLATRATSPPYQVFYEGRGWALRTPFGRRTGWEQALNEWLADMSERFGYNTTWLLELLHLQLFDNFLGPRRWYPRRGQPSSNEERDYAEFAIRLWQIPDVDLRALFQRRLEEHPQGRAWLAKVQDILSLNGFPEPGQTRTGPNKQEILRLFTDYPSPYTLAAALGKRKVGTQGQAIEAPAQTPGVPTHQPQAITAAERGSDAPPSDEKDSAVFAIVAPDFANRPIRPAASARHLPPVITPTPERAIAYQPVHVAFQALLHAIEELTEQYGETWLTWESAQTDLVQLRTALAFSYR